MDVDHGISLARGGAALDPRRRAAHPAQSDAFRRSGLIKQAATRRYRGDGARLGETPGAGIADASTPIHVPVCRLPGYARTEAEEVFALQLAFLLYQSLSTAVEKPLNCVTMFLTLLYAVVDPPKTLSKTIENATGFSVTPFVPDGLHTDEDGVGLADGALFDWVRAGHTFAELPDWLTDLISEDAWARMVNLRQDHLDHVGVHGADTYLALLGFAMNRNTDNTNVRWFADSMRSLRDAIVRGIPAYSVANILIEEIGEHFPTPDLENCRTLKRILCAHAVGVPAALVRYFATRVSDMSLSAPTRHISDVILNQRFSGMSMTAAALVYEFVLMVDRSVFFVPMYTQGAEAFIEAYEEAADSAGKVGEGSPFFLSHMLGLPSAKKTTWNVLGPLAGTALLAARMTDTRFNRVRAGNAIGEENTALRRAQDRHARVLAEIYLDIRMRDVDAPVRAEALAGNDQPDVGFFGTDTTA